MIISFITQSRTFKKHYNIVFAQQTTKIIANGSFVVKITYSSADFLKKAVSEFARKDIKVECVQTDNRFEFTNRFSNSRKDLLTMFEQTALDLGVRHKLVRPYTPRHNGKVERSHRKDQKRFYDNHRFFSLADFCRQLTARKNRSNNRPSRLSAGFLLLIFFAFTVLYD